MNEELLQCTHCKKFLTKDRFNKANKLRSVGNWCKDCKKENYLKNRYPNTTCQKCNKHQSIEANGICKPCNKELQIKECSICKKLQPKASFTQSRKRTVCSFCFVPPQKDPNIKEKICTSCKQLKSASSFAYNKSMPNGYTIYCKECLSQKAKKKRNINKEQWLKKERKRNRARYKNNPQWKLRTIISSRTRDVLKGVYKSARTTALLGCNTEYLKSYIESLFWPGMSWSNYKVDGWHIDHIIPAISFDLTKPEEQRKCFHYTNLQPLWWDDNLSKNDRLDWAPAESHHPLPERLLKVA